MCANCHSELQRLWAVGPPYPQLQTVAQGSFVNLGRCAECGQLWLESCYEPYASFKYAVPWRRTIEQFEGARDKDGSLSLCRWHEAEVRSLGNTADPLTLEHIEVHFRRSYGLVDLRPTKHSNEVEL